MRQVVGSLAVRGISRLFRLLERTLPAETLYKLFSRPAYRILSTQYYSPVPDAVDLGFLRETDMVGIDLNEAAAWRLIDEVVTPYKAEFNAFPLHEAAAPTDFYLVNGTYMAIDGNLYYGLTRRHAPRRIIEIGSGNSTFLAAAAIRRNRAEGRAVSELIAIEPYPRPELRQLPELTRLIEQRVQQVDLSLFQQLQAGDILFIDSSHVLRPGNDVWWEYCEILPRLAPGVLVHIHDISLPKPYPKVYLDVPWYWNEQWLLQAYLTHNARAEVLWAGNYLMTRYPDKMRAAFTPEYDHMRAKYPSSEPTGFWLRVKDSP